MADARSAKTKPAATNKAMASEAKSRRKAAVERPNRRAQPAEDLPDQGDDDGGDDLGEVIRTDLGPWAETPASTRVSSYRYDYLKRETQVTWRNGTNPGYAYEGMDYEAFRRFARVASKGKYINSTLDGYGYRKLDEDDVRAPSNPQRRGVSRSRG